MIRHNTLVLLTTCLALALPPAAVAAAGSPAEAAAQATGTITGRVRNIATDQYLNNARVSVKGTTHTVYTDNFGVFRLVNIPSGPAVLEVFYTDLDVAQITVLVPPGGTIEQPVDLTSVKRYGTPDTIQLDAFVVSSDRETDAQAIAINEQRFAPNIKNVMSTDSLGDVLGSSVGEFLKFMPGITAEFDNADIAGISVRGIGGGMTAITADGAPSSNIWVSATRSVDVRSMALNDISRIELTKVPTPATPADSLAGSVNMVSKSAFERSGRQLRYGVNLVGNHENLKLKPTPHSHRDRNTYKILPGANFDFTWPVTKNFGVVIAGMHTNIYNEQHFARTTWANAGTGAIVGVASTSNPFLQTFLLLDGPRNITRNTLSLKADWKVTRHSVLSLSHMANRATTRIGTLSMTFNAGTNGTAVPSSAAPMTFDPTFTRGALGRGTITNNGTNQLINQTTDSTNLKYRYDDGRWKIESGLSRSASATKRRYFDAGFFYQSSAVNNRPIRINFLDISGDRPGTLEVFDAANQPFEWRDISNFRGNTANTANAHNRGQYNTGYLNLRRRFDILPFPTALQIGTSRREQTLDTNIQSTTWNFTGPDGNSQMTAPLDPYIMRVYKDQDSHYGFHGIQWMSPLRTFRAYELNPLLYSQTVAQQVAAENSRIDNSEFIEEIVQAAYIQGEVDLFNNRLRLLTGVRFERTTDEGQGGLTDADAVWQRDASGNFLRTATGARIRKPEAGAVNSMEQLALTRTERGAFSNRTYQGYYPSFHATYLAQENLLVRGAYAKTYGRPNFTDIIPRIVATGEDLDEDDDPDPLTGRGRLTIRNPALTPWTADNFDLSVEYYTNQGGLLSAGVFLKEIKNFFGSSARFATPELLRELGLDQRYLGWNILTKFNSGDAQIKGAEFNVKHSLRALGRWGAPFTVFANATKLELSGNPGASFTSFIPKSGNWGATFSQKRILVTARWNYRGQDQRAPQAAFGPEGYEYYKARTTLDMNASYQLTRRLSLAASVNNLTNEPQTLLRYGPDTPAYARQYQEAEYGIQLAVGIRGTF
jgi:iron complex outermembrane recepter protein